MHLTITIIIILAAKVMAFKPDHVPVFILVDEAKVRTGCKAGGKNNDKNFEGNPFGRLDPRNFSKIIQAFNKQINPTVTIVFLENSLSIEDLSNKDKMGTTFPFSQESLRQEKVKYLPAVSESAKVLKETYKPYRSITLSTLNDIEKDNFNQNIYVTFKDKHNETRTQSLRKHDIIMREVINVAKGAVDGSVVAIYTGINNPVKYEELRFKTKNVLDTAVVIPAYRALFKFYGMHTSARRRRFTELPKVPRPIERNNHLTTYMEYAEFTLQFNFTFFPDRWQLDTVALIESDEEVGHTNMFISAPLHCSFVCGEPLIVFNLRDGSYISIPHYQIQPFRRSNKTSGTLRSDDDTDPIVDADAANDHDAGKDDDAVKDDGAVKDGDAEKDGDAVKGDGKEEGADQKDGEGTEEVSGIDVGSGIENDLKTLDFGEAVDCGKYFTAGILSCFFVVSILIGILIFGMTIMMDCKSGDRFDDSQGSALIIAQAAG